MKQLRGSIAILGVLALLGVACGANSDTNTDASSAGVSSGQDSEVSDESLDDASPAATPGGSTLGESDDELDDPVPQPDPTGSDPVQPVDPGPCDNVELASTEIGVTADTITVLVMADVGAPGLAGALQPAIDGVKAWARHINEEGGLACRQVEVIEHDSALNPTQTTNGFLTACENALALLGTLALFAFDTEDLQSCPDAQGNEIGVPDFAYITSEPTHQCSVVTTALNRPANSCPYSGSGPRTAQSQSGPIRWMQENLDPDLNGVFLVPADLLSTIALAMPTARVYEVVGVKLEGTPGATTFTAQSEYGSFVQLLRDSNSNFAYNGYNDQSMIKWRSEAEAQGLDSANVIWSCPLSCYTPEFLEAGAVVEGTYVWLWQLPYSEVDQNQELADFIDYIGVDFPSAWAAGSWASGVLLEQLVNEIVAEGGPNALTRQAVLDKARNLTSFDVNGWWSPGDYTNTVNILACFVLVQVQDGDFVRVHPAEPGEMDCSSDNVVEVTADWLAEYNR